VRLEFLFLARIDGRGVDPHADDLLPAGQLLGKLLRDSGELKLVRTAVRVGEVNLPLGVKLGPVEANKDHAWVGQRTVPLEPAPKMVDTDGGVAVIVAVEDDCLGYQLRHGDVPDLQSKRWK